MRAAILILLFASPVLAQNKLVDTAIAPGCGADDSKFEVKTDQSQHPVTHPEAGKALIVFIEDDTDFSSTPKPTTRAGLDGGWVGATHGNSYFSFSVDPGEHHLCASWQKAVILRQGHKAAVAHFTAEAGNVYFFRVKNSWHLDHGTAEIAFAPLDSDEGLLLASKFALSTSNPKK